MKKGVVERHLVVHLIYSFFFKYCGELVLLIVLKYLKRILFINYGYLYVENSYFTQENYCFSDISKQQAWCELPRLRRLQHLSIYPWFALVKLATVQTFLNPKIWSLDISCNFICLFSTVRCNFTFNLPSTLRTDQSLM